MFLKPVNVTLYALSPTPKSAIRLADLIKLRILRWRDYPGLCRWAQNAMLQILREIERNLTVHKRGEGHVVETKESKVRNDCATDLEDGSRCYKRQGNGFSPGASRENIALPVPSFWPND